MRWMILTILIFSMPVWGTSSVQAQIFSKKTRTNPYQRVPELILIAKTDSDERKRTHAIEELREYDAKTFEEIVPVLVDILYTDQKAGVRLEAMNSLSKIRPVSNLAGQALEHAAARDENWRIKMQAKSALARYHLAGYTAGKADAPNAPRPVTNNEPPIIDVPQQPVKPSVAPSSVAPAVRTAPAAPSGDIVIPAPESAAPPQTNESLRLRATPLGR